jgi:ribosomal protein S18 acetylase RimI-like enzyme
MAKSENLNIGYEISTDQEALQKFGTENQKTFLEEDPVGRISMICLGGHPDEIVLATDPEIAKVVGFAGIRYYSPLIDDYHSVNSRVVLPDYRRNGIGNRLLLEAIRRIRQRIEACEIDDRRIKLMHISRNSRDSMRKLLKENPEIESFIEESDSSDSFQHYCRVRKSCPD